MTPVNIPILLQALREIESANAAGALRVEPAYLPSGARVCVQGKTYVGNGRLFRYEVEWLWRQFSWLCACSLSPYQIMVPTAWRLGFREHPWRLDMEPVARPWVEKYLAEAAARIRVAGGEVTVRGLLDAYNSGSATDSVVPNEYIAKGLAVYERLLREQG